MCIQSALAFNHYDDDDDQFIEAISESWNIDPTLPLDIIKCKCFSLAPLT